MPKFSNKVIQIEKKKTSIKLAEAEWEALNIICRRENIKRNDLIKKINECKNPQLGLTCSVRLFAIIYFHQLHIDKEEKYYSSSNQFCTPIFAAIDGIL